MRKNLSYKIIFISLLLIMFSTLFPISNVLATDKARVFSTDFFSTKESDKQHAVNGLKKLKYSVSTKDSVTKSQILSWTNSGGSNYSNNNYCFYISTHGPSDSEAEQGITYFKDNNKVKIYPGDITGNWHFIYIDACNSKRNNKFPNSFNIKSTSSNRAYLGWATEVPVWSANLFNNYFWETYVTHHPIRTAAIKAAADVPGSGTTPIRFVGDTSWYGAG